MGHEYKASVKQRNKQESSDSCLRRCSLKRRGRANGLDFVSRSETRIRVLKVSRWVSYFHATMNRKLGRSMKSFSLFCHLFQVNKVVSKNAANDVTSLTKKLCVAVKKARETRKGFVMICKHLLLVVRPT